MKKLKTFILENLLNDIKSFECLLNEKELKFENNDTDYIVESEYDNMFVVFTFINENEFGYEIRKEDEVIMVEEMTYELNSLDINVLDTMLDPIKYLIEQKTSYENDIKKVECIKESRNDNQTEKYLGQLNRCKRNIERIDHIITEIR